MTKAELNVLERAFACEIDGAMKHHPGMYQTKSEIAAKLAEQGYLQWCEERTPFLGMGDIVCQGYRLTHAGRLAYCSTC